jgi:hypothetical protein
MWENGVGIPKDEMKAAEFYELAAEQGLPQAKFNLGMLLLEGRGVPADYARGKDLLQKAAEAGYDPAVRNLEQIETAELEAKVEPRH